AYSCHSTASSARARCDRCARVERPTRSSHCQHLQRATIRSGIAPIAAVAAAGGVALVRELCHCLTSGEASCCRRCHGHCPSSSASSEKLRNVLTTTTSP